MMELYARNLILLRALAEHPLTSAVLFHVLLATMLLTVSNFLPISLLFVQLPFEPSSSTLEEYNTCPSPNKVKIF